MSFVDKLVENKPSKYDTLIENKIVTRKIKMKVREYNALQDQYANLLKNETINRKPSTSSLEKIKGQLNQISASGKDWLWGIAGDQIYTCEKPCNNGNWLHIPGDLKQIEGGNKEVWGVTKNDNIYKMNQDHSNGWRKIPGKLKFVSQGGGWVWGINNNNYVYRCKSPCNGDWILDSVPKSPYFDTNSFCDGNKIYVNARSTPTSTTQENEESCEKKCANDENCDMYLMSTPNTCITYKDTYDISLFCNQGNDPVPHMYWGKVKSNIAGNIIRYPTKDSLINKIFNYLGNWGDDRNRRLPVTIDGGRYKYTQASCNKACQDYKYYGLQNGNGYKGQCFCGNSWSRATSLGKCGGNKITGGGWCNSIYDTKKEDELVTINVGSSGHNRKKVRLPYDNMIVSPYALNIQNPRWGDRFEVKVSGRELTVTRTDANSGWGQHLKLQGIRNDIQPPNNAQEGPKMEMLSCSETHVYGLDSNGYAWRKNVDGTGNWERFGNPSNMQFSWLNASSNNKVYATHGKVFNGVNYSFNKDQFASKASESLINRIYETDMNGKNKWTMLDYQDNGYNSFITSLSSDYGNLYFTNNFSDSIFKYSPFKNNGGYWIDIKNENYMKGLVNGDETSNNNFKFLGKTDNLKDCKIKAVEDEKNEFSSVTYVSDKAGSPFSKSCYGNVVGGKNNPTYQQGVTTSLAPNGTTIIGGEEGKKLMKEMKKVHNEIEELTQKAREVSVGMKRSNSLLLAEKSNVNIEMEEMLAKLRKDRIAINKILEEPEEVAKEENSNIRQTSNYAIYVLWILLVIISLFMVYYMFISRDENISPVIYIFLAIWIIILGKQYYNQIVYYGGSSVNYISKILSNPTA